MANYDNMDAFLEDSQDPSAVLLYGEAGSGKTVSFITLLELGYKVRFLATEQNAVSGVKKAMQILKARSKAEDYARYTANLSIAVITKQNRKLTDVIKDADKTLKTPLKSLKLMPDINKKTYSRYVDIIKALSDYVDLLGREFGSVEDWDAETVLFFDGNTALTEAIEKHIVGSKVVYGQDEYGVMQKIYKEFIRTVSENFGCKVVILGHPKRDKDEVLGGVKIFPVSIGKALDTWLPTAFAEVIWAYRKDGKFYWSTDDKLAVTRAKELPISSQMPADFSQIWKPVGAET